MNIDAHRGLQVSVGFATATGRRPDNQDFVGALLPSSFGKPFLAALADGVGGHKGGREAAELTVRSFLDDYSGLPETLGPRRAASRVLEAVNSWIHAQGRLDPLLRHMSCAFSGVVVSRRLCHVLHVGDSRVYRLSEGRLERLTEDHVAGPGDYAHVLRRAIGFEDTLRLDYRAVGLRQHDRFMLCSDGVHGRLDDRRLLQLLGERLPPEEAAHALVEAALAAGGQDNATALVVDILAVPPADRAEIAGLVATLPIGALPKSGDIVDGFQLGDVLSDGRYSRLFHARQSQQTGERALELVVKFPRPNVAAENSYKLAFAREAWVAARVRSPFVGEVVELAPARQTRLYTVMPYYDGGTLEQRLKRSPRVGLKEGVDIAGKVSRGLVALHRAGVVHRDIKPENIVLTRGGARLIDLGVALVPGLDDFPASDVPGTPSYMAPELFQGKPGDELSDLYALGATLYRMFAGAWPYGEIEPFTRPRFGKLTPLAKHRPDLPSWLDDILARAVAVDPAHRFGDVIEFAHELENGAAWAGPAAPAKMSFYERDPLLFWKIACVVLAVALAAALAWR